MDALEEKSKSLDTKFSPKPSVEKGFGTNPGRGKHEHFFKPVFAISELAFYECRCGATKPSSWTL